jgi:hypothetical protein
MISFRGRDGEGVREREIGREGGRRGPRREYETM